jgi:hypothetical protein
MSMITVMYIAIIQCSADTNVKFYNINIRKNKIYERKISRINQ